MKSFSKWLEIGSACVLAVIPTIWFVPGHWSFGTDAAFPPNPLTIFWRRQFIWNPVFLGGTDRSLDLPNTEFFMGMQAALALLGLNLGIAQTLVNVFWYGLEGLSFYYLMRVLFKGRDPKQTVIRLTGTIFYALNFYQIYLWGNIQIAPVATVIATPLTLAVITKSLELRRVDRASLALMLGASFLGAAMGTEPPSLIAYSFITIGYFLFLSLAKGYWKSRNDLVSSIRIFLILVSTFVLANAYWILPSANFIVNSNYLNTQFGSQVFAVNLLLPQTSQFTSLLNIFRILGDLFLYTGFGGQPYSPWFSFYQTNTVMILISFLLPLLAFAAPLVYGRNSKVLFFSAFSVIILFLVKGIHEPFGWVYSWLIANFPGFWIFRAPWEHFFSVGIAGLAFLGAVTSGWIFQKVERRSRILASILICIIIISTIGYNEAFILGRMIPSSEGDVGYHQYYNVGFDRVIPGYAFQASNWVNILNSDSNIYVLPALRANIYDWGYASASDFTPYLFNKGVLEQQYGQGTAPPNSMQLMYNMFAATLNGNQFSNASKILSLLNVGYVLERKDFVYNFYGGSDSPAFIESQLNQMNGLHADRAFGSWDFYSNDYVEPKVYGSGNLIFVDGSLQALYQLTNTQYIQGLNIIYFSSQQPADHVKLASSLATVRMTEQTDTIARAVNSTSGNFSWASKINSTSPIVVSNKYVGWKPIISTNGKGTTDMLIFSSPNNAPYVFPNNATDWSGFNSTLIYVQTGSSPLQIDSIGADGVQAPDVVGVWWETGWVGMVTRQVTYPLIIPANQRAIIQINHLTDRIQLNSTSLSTPVPIRAYSPPPTVSFRNLDPTKYQVEISTSRPFVLVFSTPYDPQWKAFDGDPHLLQLTSQAIPESHHLLINGYANGWYVNKNGTFTMTLYYTPQNLYYVGLGITLVFTITLFISLTRLRYVWKVTFLRFLKSLRRFYSQ